MSLKQADDVSEDCECSPECLLTAEPVKDPYSTDEEKNSCRKKTSDKKDHCDSQHSSLSSGTSCDLSVSIKKDIAFGSCVPMNCSTVQKSFIESHFNAKYSTIGPNADVLIAETTALQDVLEEMLYFALKEDESRMTTNEEGIRLYDGKSVNDIIVKWQNDSSDAAWIFKNFDEDVTFGNAKLSDPVNKLLSSKPTKDKSSMSDMFSNQIRLTFMKRICQVLLPNVIDKPSHDELHEQYKSLIGQFANITGVSYRFSGQCKYASEILDPYMGEVTQVITKPDFLFESYSETLTLPVQVHVPAVSKTGLCSAELNGQHVMQLIAALHYKLKYIENPSDEEKNIVQVGMFMTKKYIRFTKIETSLRHLSSSFPDLLPRGGSFYMLSNTMMDRRREDGLKVVFSNWYIDLSTAVHRNALLIFISEYFHGNNYA